MPPAGGSAAVEAGTGQITSAISLDPHVRDEESTYSTLSDRTIVPADRRILLDDVMGIVRDEAPAVAFPVRNNLDAIRSGLDAASGPPRADGRRPAAAMRPAGPGFSVRIAT
jgi:hypothetical protein